MKFSGWVMSAGLVLMASAAQAQVLPPNGSGESPYAAVSDFDGPYAAMPPEPAAPRYGGPLLLPPTEVYTVLRESGFSPLGMPHLRGFVYSIAVIDRRGDDGRLLIDARTGRIIRFMPAYRMGNNFNGGPGVIYGPGGPPPVNAVRGSPRPPESVPYVASRTPPVPTPRAAPPRGGEITPLATKPAPAAAPTQQSAAVQAKPADVPAASQAAAPAAVAPAPLEAKPAAPPIQPTQEMPKAQGLE